MYDVIIIGAGPAGITAGLYTQRGNLKTLIIHNGKTSLENANKIENYYGFENGITGKELYFQGIRQAQNIGIDVKNEEVIKIEMIEKSFKVKTTKNEYISKTIIIAMGTKKKTLQIDGVKKFEGRGISYCAICDGFFYRNKDVAVIGNGDYAISEVNDLLPVVNKITILTNGKTAPDIRSEKVEINKLLEKLDLLKTKFYEIIAREVERAENCPINSYDTNRIAEIFKCINDEFSSVDYTKIEKWLLETKIATIERYIDSYGIYKYELDKEQERFLELYLRYKESCEKIGDTCREAVEFDSLQELEEEINSRNDMLNRLKDRSALLEELRKESGSDDVARELYICYAIETELNRMNYEIADKTSAETIVGEKLKNYRLKDKLLQYYEHEGNSMMQLFKVSDEVGLQLIVHSDGTSTMETISLKKTDNNTVMKIQKEHCERTKKLEEALKKNWGIKIELEEVKASADHVAIEFETMKQKVNNTNKYMEIRRKKAIEKRRKNAEKKKERSIALRY